MQLLKKQYFGKINKQMSDFTKASFLTEFCFAMESSGHDNDFREIVIRRAVGKYIRAWERREKEGTEVYRSKEEKQETTRLAGGKPGKGDWFTGLGYSNTLTVPATIGSSLAKKVTDALKHTDPPGGFKTLVLEDGGVPIRRDMIKSNPFPLDTCGRETCLVCIHSPSRGKCWEGNVTYSITCKRSPCINDGIPTPTYVGETCRSCFPRGSEHLALYQNKSKGSFMWRHNQLTHGGKMGENNGAKDFQMKKLHTYRHPLDRILEEAVLIQRLEGNKTVECLNSKEEYFGAEYIRPCFPKGPAQ